MYYKPSFYLKPLKHTSRIIGGTEANIWLNNWWNRVHEDEFPDETS